MWVFCRRCRDPGCSTLNAREALTCFKCNLDRNAMANPKPKPPSKDRQRKQEENLWYGNRKMKSTNETSSDSQTNVSTGGSWTATSSPKKPLAAPNAVVSSPQQRPKNILALNSYSTSTEQDAEERMKQVEAKAAILLKKHPSGTLFVLFHSTNS